MRASKFLSCLVAAALLACSSSPKGSGTGGATGTSTSSGGATATSTSSGAGTTTVASTGGAAGSGGVPGSGGSDAGAGGSLADGDAGLPDVFGPVPDGGVFVQFVKSDETTYFDESQENKATGTITFGAPNAAASDDNVANLTRKGGQAELGTDGAEEIVSNRPFSFGTFRYRLSLAQCAATEEVDNGPFTYFNDGSLAPDGLAVNREVDIEILCGEPYLINLTIWTEYTDDTHCKNQSRVIDTRTGTVSVFADDQSSGDQTGTESHPELALPGWPEAGTFYEMGFTWAPDHLTYFMVVGGTMLTLWDATDATRIPQLPMEQHFNIWATGESWSTGNAAPPPASDATLALDWFRYDPQ